MTTPSRILEGRSALVTGSAKGLGRQIANSLAAAGATVGIHYRSSEDEANFVVKNIKEHGGMAFACQADLADPTQVDSLMVEVRDRFSQLDFLINNVGNYLVKPLSGTTAEDFHAILGPNLVAPHVLIAGLSHMMPDDKAGIVNIGYAGIDQLSPHSSATAYQISKTGLLVLTKSWAEELAPRRIKVNMVSPGQLENSVDLPEKPEDALPFGRPGHLREVSDVVMFLLAGTSYVTGVNVDVAGGYRL